MKINMQKMLSIGLLGLATSLPISVFAQTPGYYPVPTNVAAWWPAEGNGLDIINGNDGVLEGGLAFGIGEVWQAFLFNNTNADLKVPASATLNVGAGGSFTLEAWINPTNVTERAPLFEWNTGTGTNYWGVHFYIDPISYGAGPGALYANIVDTGGGWHQIHTSGGVVSSNVFQHVALTYNGSNGVATIYCNGVQEAQTTFGSFTPQTSYNLYLGRRPPTFGETYSFGGLIDEPAIYSRALSATEIQAIYNVGAIGKIPAATPVPADVSAWWPGEGNALDITNFNDGTLEGGVEFTKGQVWQTFVFDNTNADVVIPASATLNVGQTNGLTLEAWIDPTDVSVRAPIFEWNTGTGTNYWGVHFYIDPISGGVGPGALYANIVDTSGGWHQIQSGAGVTVSNVFQHVALTYDDASGVATLYCNGAIVQQENLGSFTPLTSYNLYLGRRPPTFGETYSFPGGIDEPTIYNRALSAAEIRAIFSAGKAGKIAASTLVATNVQGWWPAEDNTDDIVHGDDGILEGGADYGLGNVGQTFDFNNPNADVRIPATTNLNIGLGSGITLEAWIYPTNVAQRAPIFEWNTGTGTNYWGVHFYIDPISGGVGPGALYANVVDTSGGWHQIQSGAGVTVSNVFQHVALTYDESSGVATLYCNGLPVSQTTLGSFTPLTSYDLYLGRRPPTFGETYSFPGGIDESTIYNRALSAAEIRAIFDAGKGGKYY